MVLVVDLKYRLLVDNGPKTWPESSHRRRQSHGRRGWQAVAQLARLLPEARERGVPVVYSGGFEQGSWWFGSARLREMARHPGGVFGEVDGNTIASRVAPQPEDLRLAKPRRRSLSVRLAALLDELQADTLIVTGFATGGSLHSIVVDSFSLRYRVGVVADCAADRHEESHARTLSEIRQKYAAVQSVEETISYLRSLPRALFETQLSDLRRAQEARRLALLKGAASL